MRVGFALAQTGAFFVIVAVASSTFWPVYRDGAFVVLVAAAFALGAAIALAGTFLRLSSFWLLVLVVIAFALFGVALAVPNQAIYGVLPSLEGLRELVVGVSTSWKQLLTITLPVGSYQALLVPALVLVLVGTTVGLSTALRSRRGELALIPPVVIYIAGIVFGPTEALLPLVTGLVLLAASIIWVVWWRLRRRRQSIERLLRITPGANVSSQRTGNSAVARRAIGGAVLTLAIASAAAVAATTTLAPAGARWVARDAVVKPFDPRDYVSPLSGFRSYEQTPTVDRPQLTVTGLTSGQFLRIAALDTYDGVEYSVGSDQVSTASGTFTRVPTSFDQSKVSGTQQSIDVTVDGYSGVWLPTVGKLESIDFSGSDAGTLRDSFFFNDTTGTAAVVGDIGRGVSYRLTAVDPRQPSTGDLEGLTPGSSSVPSPTNVPQALKTRLQSYVDGVSGQGARLQAALKGLRSDGYVSHGVGADEPVSRSGHGTDRLTQLFTDPIMLGDAEQYAAAAALMADQLGFPARVVLGFSSTESTGGTTTFTGGDITARIEVDTAQYGWVSLDPNPEPRTIPKDTQTDPDQVSRPQSVIQPPQQEADPQNNQAQPQSKQDNPADQPAWVAILLLVGRIAGWVALGAGIVMAPFLTIVALKARRRARRRRLRDPAQRMTSGWQEYQDAVVDHGIEPVPTATRSEVATTVGSSRAGVLARVVDRSVFAPEPAGKSEADRVWKAVGEMRGGLDDNLTRWQRFAAAVSTRSLRGYHSRKPSKR
ncbi:transglutaminase superfamily protein [Frondihabitans sp. PhB188]|nr:transglutaminase superfamily protein [Frondihabitans sp. PhB188]